MRILCRVAGLVLIGSLTSCDGTYDDIPCCEQPMPEPSPVPGAGMRVVGFGLPNQHGGVVLEVPETWDVEQGACSKATGDGVYFDGRLQKACVYDAGHASLLVGLASGDGLGPGAVVQNVNGMSIESLDGCADAAYCAFAETIVVDTGDEGLLLTLHGPSGSRPVLRAIARSIKPMPESWVAVPYVGYDVSTSYAAALLESSGFHVEVPTNEPPSSGFVGSEPAAGSVIAYGADVRLLVGGS